MAAERLAQSGVAVTVFDHMPSVARKFLMAGRGGLNLTHAEPTERLVGRFREAASVLSRPIAAFDAEALRAWCEGLGEPTFVGSSGRVFPKSLKASPLLRAWLRRLEGLGVRFRLRTRWTGFSPDGGLMLEDLHGRFAVRPDVSLFALGGASWPRLGGDGGWSAAFEAAGVGLAPFRPANCGFGVGWSRVFAQRFAGAPLKRAALRFEGETARGEAVITSDGIEGGLVYALSAPLRDAIERAGEARPTLDLRPDLDEAALAARLARPRGKRSLSTHLAKAVGLSPLAVALLREGGPPPEDAAALAGPIKALELRLVAAKGLDRAISTAGGVRLDEVDEDFMLKMRAGVFVMGEMLDWEAPTGGYLLHACLATGRAAGDAAARRLAEALTADA